MSSLLVQETQKNKNKISFGGFCFGFFTGAHKKLTIDCNGSAVG